MIYDTVMQDIAGYPKILQSIMHVIILYIIYLSTYYKILQNVTRYGQILHTTRYCKTLQESRTVAAAIVPLVRVLNWRKPKRWGTIGQDGLL